MKDDEHRHLHFHMSKRQETLINRNKLSYLIISFTQGISSLADLAIQYYFKDELLLQPYEMSRILAFLMIPWIIKPLLGLLTDLVPVFGYRRKVYLLTCGMLSSLSWILLAFYATSLLDFLVLLFIISFSMSFSSVIGEAIVVELANIQEKMVGHNVQNEKAKNYVSLFFLLKNTGALVAAFFRGYLVELMLLKNIFLLNSFIPFMIFIAGIIVIEPKVQNEVSINHDSLSHEITKIQYYEKYYSVEQMSDEKKEGLLTHYKTTFELIEINKKQLFWEFYQFVTKREVYIPSLFAIVLYATPSFSDPFFYYMTNFLLFSPSQLGFLSLISSTGVLIAILSYRLLFKNWTFKNVIILSSVFYFVFTFLSYLLVVRFNTYLGISDFLFCNIGFLFLSIFGELLEMPILTLACTLSPKKLEATVYSFFMSSINLGTALSTLNSSFLTSWYGITANNFSNLGKMIIFSNIFNIIPVFIIIYSETKYFEVKEKVHISEELEEHEEILNAINHNQNIGKHII